MMQITFLGCGDAKGVPRIGCRCGVCREARAPTSKNARTCSALTVRVGPRSAERLVQIDAGPEYRTQAVREDLDVVDALLITHAHDDHILGLSNLVNAHRLRQAWVQVLAPDDVLEGVRARFGYLWTEKIYRQRMQVEPLAHGRGADLWGLDVTPLRVDHGFGGTAYGYLLRWGSRRVAYFPDALRLGEEAKDRLGTLDLLILGTNHYYEGIEMWRRSVMDMVTALELITELQPAQAILTHLSHTVDYVTYTGPDSPLPASVSLAYDGRQVEFLDA
jgi:phosphoribosyl 1,2-cyclic phosphate phosphodiesterase